MPAKSAKQKKLMDAAAHNPAFAKKVGIPTKVAKKFSRTSKGMEFQKGGTVNRVGDAVTPSRRDPDIGKMIKEVKVPKRLQGGGMAKKSKGC
jgi:hypothetical protein